MFPLSVPLSLSPSLPSSTALFVLTPPPPPFPFFRLLLPSPYPRFPLSSPPPFSLSPSLFSSLLSESKPIFQNQPILGRTLVDAVMFDIERASIVTSSSAFAAATAAASDAQLEEPKESKAGGKAGGKASLLITPVSGKALIGCVGGV